jgi:hypothetical protein
VAQPFEPYSNVLPYGSTIQQGAFACRSESAFLACADVKTQKGFIVSKTEFRTYHDLLPRRLLTALCGRAWRSAPVRRHGTCVRPHAISGRCVRTPQNLVAFQ